ncbi:SpoIIE family protein phosphatase [Streptomyces sp. NPDC013740]|uniref:SpoIIE family protein phosphatase n=1 Tax=Streptomyces sp. NPDC013740 TaxID=3364867 RepID=UPI0037033B23
MPAIEEPPGVGGTVDTALDLALAGAVHRTGASIGLLYLIEPAEPVLRLVALCGLPVEFTAPWQRLPLTAPVPVADAIGEDRLVWVGGQDEMARRYPRAAAVLPYRFALAAFPVTGRRRCWGGVVLMWPADHPQEIATRERAHLRGHAAVLCRILDGSTEQPSLPDRPRLVPRDAVAGPAPTGLAAADFAERLPEGALALDLEGRITFLTRAAARLLDREPGRLLGTRPWQALPWLDDPAYEDQYRTAVVSREPVSFTALRPPDHWLTFQLYPDASGISVRVTQGREQASSTLPPASARRPAAATGRLYQLVHLAAMLSEAVGVHDLVGLIAEHALPAFGAQGLVLSAVDAGRLKIIGRHGYPAHVIERLDGLPLNTDVTPAGQVLAGGVPAFFADRDEMAARHPEATRLSDKQAWAYLPLTIAGRPVGCCIISYDRPHRFSADERAVLTSLGGLVAQALDRARLHDAQHDLAQQLQQALLPRNPPAVPGLDIAARYLPAVHDLQVGGDFYDVLRLDATTVAAVVGDVEGHSISAAALMGQVRTAIHAHATSGASPAQVLAHTNRLLADLDSELLVSCLYVHLDLAHDRLTLANAGHVPPLLRTAPGRARVLDAEPGPLLGVGTRADYPVTAAPFPPGALLALYTDGLVEVPGVDPALTTAALARHLADTDDPLPRLADGLVRQSWPDGRPTDDITVLLVRDIRRTEPGG